MPPDRRPRPQTTLRRLPAHDRAAVEANRAARRGVTGVPCFIIGNKYGVMGAQTADVWQGHPPGSCGIVFGRVMVSARLGRRSG
jgi:hypothetical protein